MFKVSELISMPVISLFESEFRGIIYNIIFDTRQKKCKYICLLDENEGIKHKLKMSDIYLIGEECVFIKNNTMLELDCDLDIEQEFQINPLNLKTYNLLGKYYGTSTDIIIDEKYNISSVVLNTGNIIESNQIFNIGKSIILIDKNNNNISKFKPKQKVNINKVNDNKVIMLSNINNIVKQNESIETIETNKIITDFRFLVGRILNKDIIAINGEMIAKNGSTITKEIVNKASSYGKLVEVARYSIKDKKISN